MLALRPKLPRGAWIWRIGVLGIALDQSLNALQLLGIAIALGSLVAGQRIAAGSGRMKAWTPTGTPNAALLPETSSSRLVGASRAG